MARLHETIETRLPLDETFAFVADFANIPAWDPNTVTAERLDPGPVGVGARYALGVRQRGAVVPMAYRVVTWEPGRRVVLTGEGRNIRATDEIRFAPSVGGTRVDYTADIDLTGWMRLLGPLARPALERIAKDAAAGMQRALEQRAAGAAA
jgi:carbon monoxide dehydrogenase subunit G